MLVPDCKVSERFDPPWLKAIPWLPEFPDCTSMKVPETLTFQPIMVAVLELLKPLAKVILSIASVDNPFGQVLFADSVPTGPAKMTL